jgi:hypothetical protein
MSTTVYQWGTFTSFANLVAQTTPIDGNVAQIVMNGNSTNWKYDGTLLTWRINDIFSTTSATFIANTPLAGMQGGDFAKATDTGQVAQWNSIQGSYTYVS